MDLTGSALLSGFASEVGTEAGDAVSCVGGRTQWDVGGAPQEGAREVRPPAGVVAHEPGEMIVRVRAGTTLAELAHAVAEGGQLVTLESADPARATVGGLLACGRSGLRRLGRGPLRDSVLEVTAVTSRGDLIRAGAPLVKNVTGFDLCRLLVGSVGTLAFLAEAVLRCQPEPEVEAWWRSDPEAGVDPFALYAGLYRPLAVLWDGASVWVGLAGRKVDVDAQARSSLPAGPFRPVEEPPALPGSQRRSLPPGALKALPSSGLAPEWLAEVGVGLVHCSPAVAASMPAPAPSSGVVEIHRRLKERFDPSGRLNPGRSPLAAAS
ncbi:MAG TPA: FAD-binding protein [Acidimicrobiales bacterium]|nr:FAD-binding protein [Acidimicrobiales bacterium]